jgi:topoisomerase IV subunit A
MGKEGSSIQWFSSNSNGEAEIVKIQLRPKPKLKKNNFEFDFASLSIRNKGSMGNIVSKNPIQRIALKSSGISTLERKQLWFDWDILRLNDEERGMLLGNFRGDEHILAICKDGTFYSTDLDLSNRYQGEVFKIETLSKKVYTAIYWDEEAKNYYIKRFEFEISDNTSQYFISESKGSRLIAVSDDKYPQIKLIFDNTGKRSKIAEEIIDAESFISVKGFRAKGKKATYMPLLSIDFIEPLQKEEVNQEEANEYPEGEHEDTEGEQKDSDGEQELTLF